MMRKPTKRLAPRALDQQALAETSGGAPAGGGYKRLGYFGCPDCRRPISESIGGECPCQIMMLDP